MEGNFLEYIREINLFMQHYCANAQTRRSIIDHFDVSVHLYEIYAPGQRVFGWANMGKLISEDGIMFRVENRRTGLILYPVFRSEMAKDMLLDAIETILTEKQKKYVKMHYFMDKPMKEIAKELGVNPSTVTRTIQSAKKRLSILSFFLK